MRRLHGMAAVLAALLTSSAANAATDWSGDSVHGLAQYPTRAVVFRDLGIFTVPSSGFLANRSGTVLIAYSVDADQVSFTAVNYDFFFRQGPFNGFTFTDVTRNPHIDSVILDPASTSSATGADASFTGRTVSFNFHGQSWTVGQTAIYDLGFGPSPVPEPGSWGMMLLGGVAAGAALRRRGAVNVFRSAA